MPLFNWKEEYSVNIEELDHHHKKFMDILNALYDDCFERDKDLSVGHKIDELIAYTKYHFMAEENFMRYVGYGQISDHLEKHEQFARKLMELKQTSNGNQLELTRELIICLGTWLLQHILEEDKRY